MSLDRASVMALLDRLGSESDEEVLTAARTLSQQLGEAGLSWDDILLPADDDGSPAGPEEDEALETEDPSDDHDDRDADADDDADDDLQEEDELPDDESDAEDEPLLDGDVAEDRARLARLLDHHKLSRQTREDLIELEAALDDGEFTEADRRYLQALEARLQ